MFRKFDPDHDVSTSTQVKSSVQRGIKSQILSSHPSLTDDILDELLPKKPPLTQYKVGPHLMLYCRGTEPVFFQHRDGPILPSLKFVHKYPNLEFTRVTVDRGAIPFVLGGAHIMCPGLTNPGSEMPPDGVERDAQGFDAPGLERGQGVVVYAEGKEYALAVGFMKMSSADVREKNKGAGVEVCHYLGDGLYLTDEVE
uniref:PUA domain-containing protein n=1 Tax=Odontella aurita TaxID=265563 RepID=A0A7S4HR81_9STRA|mmetsp:Transcript_13819/g.40426  ORF Transcript_13819/g.40426 Transcript_13819/m.40426 type:complete len:198 (+) Transcript_13819:198-791(+)|eukprot:CAMPEP_0113557098 /NCGR_PEP_ID=MMETSP0015_2-20120614/17606_1 /TAXON_ID=2838 /ORGANISM="Odontella" /LENGTH=197 /DNA_ID=CAMNT_0000458493 /DNA_START=145 /DNA_END=738 /DNA_ORIENTATION=- /assembly_acc=CAM_ASM_000160